VPDDATALCDDCGAPAVGRYQFYYPNPDRDGGPPGKHAEWSVSRSVCLTHKHVREAAGHRSRLPVEELQGNAPDPAHDPKLAGAAALRALADEEANAPSA